MTTWLYIVECNDGTLYTGVTGDVNSPTLTSSKE